jgi:hypothetical protein
MPWGMVELKHLARDTGNRSFVKTTKNILVLQNEEISLMYELLFLACITWTFIHVVS